MGLSNELRSIGRALKAFPKKKQKNKLEATLDGLDTLLRQTSQGSLPPNHRDKGYAAGIEDARKIILSWSETSTQHVGDEIARLWREHASGDSWVNNNYCQALRDSLSTLRMVGAIQSFNMYGVVVAE